jgi:hypothetical protein
MFKDQQRARAYQRQWESKNREKRNERSRQRIAANREGMREYWRRWYMENREEINARRRQRHRANPERERERNRLWYATHCQEKLRKRAEWGRANPEKTKKNVQLRRARRRGTTVETFLHAEIFERDSWHCRTCGHETLHRWERFNIWSPELDHIVPLSCGGPHTKANTQLLCALCNRRKSAQHI